MFVTNKEHPKKFDILLNVRQLDGSVTYQFDNMLYVGQLINSIKCLFGVVKFGKIHFIR
jgi:hypothetical protein